MFVMTPHGVKVVKGRKGNTAAAVLIDPNRERATHVGRQRAFLEDGGKVGRSGERIVAGDDDLLRNHVKKLTQVFSQAGITI